MKLTKRETTLLFLLAIVAIVFLGINYLILPKIAQNKLKQESLSQLDDLMIQQNTDVKIIGTIDTQIAQEREKADSLTGAFAMSIGQDQIDNWLHGLIKQNGLSLYSIELSDIQSSVVNFNAEKNVLGSLDLRLPIQNAADMLKGTLPSNNEEIKQENTDTAVPAGELPCTTVILNITGTFGDVMNFMDALYKSGRSLVVDSFSVNDYEKSGKMAVAVIRFFGAPLLDESSEIAYDFPEPAGRESLMNEKTQTKEIAVSAQEGE